MRKCNTLIKCMTALAIILMIGSIFSAGALAAPGSNGKGNGNGQPGKSINSAPSGLNGGEETGSAEAAGNGADEEDEDEEDDENEDSGDISVDQSPMRNKDKIKQKDRNVSEIRERVTLYREERKQTRETLRAQKELYKNSKQNFLGIRAQVRAGEIDANDPEALNATGKYLNSSIDYMIAHLENVKANLENSNGAGAEQRIAAIDEKIALLEEEKENIEKAESQEDYLFAVKSVRGVWNEAKKTTMYGAGQTVSEKMADVLERSEALSERLESEIGELEDEDKAAELEAKLSEYTGLIGTAKEKQERADEIYLKAEPMEEELKEASELLRDALSDVNEANRLLKEIFVELKENGDSGDVEDTGDSEDSENTEGSSSDEEDYDNSDDSSEDSSEDSSDSSTSEAGGEI